MDQQGSMNIARRDDQAARRERCQSREGESRNPRVPEADVEAMRGTDVVPAVGMQGGICLGGQETNVATRMVSNEVQRLPPPVVVRLGRGELASAVPFSEQPVGDVG